MKFPIYLDNHSTTKIDDEVIKLMLPYFTENYGNASSKSHSFGWMAEESVEFSREIIANFIGANKNEIIFTSGTSESNNFILKGIAESVKEEIHVITSKTEHPSVLETLKFLSRKNVKVTFLNVDSYGLIDLNELESSITAKTKLVSIIAANNEIGTISPLKVIGEICKKNNILFHSDAAQAIGRINFDVNELNLDFVSFSAHKNHGPKGIGATFIRKKNPKIKIIPLIHGGGQENQLRAGTLNVPGIIGFGKSVEISKRDFQDNSRIKSLRDKLQNSLTSEFPDFVVNGHPENRLPNNLNMIFRNVNVDKLFLQTRNIAFSTTSACASAKAEESHVLKAIGINKDLLKNSVRFGLSKFTTEEEIDYAISTLVESIKNIRKFSYF